MLETSKKVVYERNVRSKIIVVCAIENKVNDVYLKLTKMKSTTHQHVSFKNSSPEERVAATHANELINVKARYETLRDVKIETSAKHKNETKRLGSTLKEVNNNSCP